MEPLEPPLNPPLCMHCYVAMCHLVMSPYAPSYIHNHNKKLIVYSTWFLDHKTST